MGHACPALRGSESKGLQILDLGSQIEMVMNNEIPQSAIYNLK